MGHVRRAERRAHAMTELHCHSLSCCAELRHALTRSDGREADTDIAKWQGWKIVGREPKEDRLNRRVGFLTSRRVFLLFIRRGRRGFLRLRTENRVGTRQGVRRWTHVPHVLLYARMHIPRFAPRQSRHASRCVDPWPASRRVNKGDSYRISGSRGTTFSGLARGKGQTKLQ